MSQIFHIIILVFFVSGCSQKSDQANLKNAEDATTSPGKQQQLSIKVTMVPFQITGGLEFEEFQKKFDQYLKAALKERPDIIVFPELISFDLFPIDVKKDQIKNYLLTTSKHFDSFANTVKDRSIDYGVHILAGSFHRKTNNKDELFYNTAVWTNPDGQIKYQDKIYLTPWEQNNFFSPGQFKLTELVLKKGDDVVNAVTLICHDVEFPNLYKLLKKIKPEIIFVPSMTDDKWGYERVSRTSQARSVENVSYVVQVTVTQQQARPGRSRQQQPQWHSYYGGAELYVPQAAQFKNVKEVNATIGNDIVRSGQVDISLLREARANKANIYPIRDIQ